MSNVVAIDSKNAISFSSFGEGGTTMGGDQFRPRTIFHGDRFVELEAKEATYLCTRHDRKMYDFDGRVISPRSVQPLISSEKSPIYIPLNQRRPSAPIRLGKTIVDAYTSLIFGENRYPAIKVEGDDNAQDFAQTCSRVGGLPMAMIRARSLGGAMGTVGISWCFHDGVPRFEVHNAKNLYVHSWIDRVMLLPRHVTEVYLFYRVVWDGKGFNKKQFWFRRDWTPDADFVFRDVPYERDRDPFWEIDEEKSSRHGESVVHFEWVQNLPTDEIDGAADYDGLYDQLDQLDVLSSVVTRGAIINLDPTLLLKMDPDQINRTGVRKGSDNALIVGESGDASYMELTGNSIEAGIKLMSEIRRSILETAQCVVADPNEVAAQGTSSVALKMMYAPMLARGDVLREQYATPVRRMLQRMTEVARARLAEPIEAVDPQTNETAPAKFTIALPPKIVEAEEPELEPVIDPMTGQQAMDPMTGQPTMQPTGAMLIMMQPVARDPGVGGEVTVVWPPYFPPTFDDQSKLVGAMQIATGGKAFVSTETATDVVSMSLGIDPAEERRRLQAEAEKGQSTTAGMFPGIGGQVEPPPVNVAPGPRSQELPAGAGPEPNPPPVGPAPGG